MSKAQTIWDIIEEMEEKSKIKVDPILYISESYLNSLERGARLQGRTVDNYLRIHFDEKGLVIQRQKPQ